MKAFTAQIIYRIICEDVFSEQYEEQWRLVFAEDETQALEAARVVGKKDECRFADRYGRDIRWQLVAVKEICPAELTHGALLFSSIKEIEPIAAPLWSAAERTKLFH